MNLDAYSVFFIRKSKKIKKKPRNKKILIAFVQMKYLYIKKKQKYSFKWKNTYKKNMIIKLSIIQKKNTKMNKKIFMIKRYLCNEK